VRKSCDSSIDAMDIYALFYLEPQTCDKKYFYVGQSNDLGRRLKEHRRLISNGTEDKYVFMRQLARRGVAWDADTLKIIPDGEHPPDHERWYVIKLVRDGHELQNMRHGSRAHQLEIAQQVADLRIRSVVDVRRDRERRAVRAGEASKRLRRKILKSALKNVGIPDVATDLALPPRLRARLQQHGVTSIERGVELSFIVQTARPDRQMRELEAKIAALAPLRATEGR